MIVTIIIIIFLHIILPFYMYKLDTFFHYFVFLIYFLDKVVCII